MRQEVVDYYVGIELVKQAAQEYNITVTDEAVDEAVSKMKERYTDDAGWQAALDQADTNEERYRESVRVGMIESQLQEQVVGDSQATDEEVLSYAQMYAPTFSGAKRSSHVLFNSSDAGTAQNVLDRINSGELSFEDAARQYSIDTVTATNGGDAGWDLLNSYITDYTNALSGLEPGQTSGLVNSEYGIHIIRCTDLYTAPEEITNLDQLPPEFIDYLRTLALSSSRSVKYSEWLSDYKANADVQINPMPSNAAYAVDMSKYQLSTLENSSEASQSSEGSSSSEPSQQGEAASSSESSPSGEANPPSEEASQDAANPPSEGAPAGEASPQGEEAPAGEANPQGEEAPPSES